MRLKSKQRANNIARSVRIASFAVILLVAKSGASYAAPVPLTKCDELRRLQLVRDSSLIIVDVRLPNDFLKSHIEGARNIPTSIVTANLPREANIVVYCSEPDCPLSTNAANSLATNGYSRVSLLEGGFNGWVSKGYPVQKSPSPESQAPKTPHVSAHETRHLLAAGTIALDVRPATEFAAGHLPGARNIPIETIDTALFSLSKDAHYIVYDRQPARTHRAEQKLIAAGLHVSELSGGLADWVKKKYPLETK